MPYVFLRRLFFPSISLSLSLRTWMLTVQYRTRPYKMHEYTVTSFPFALCFSMYLNVLSLYRLHGSHGSRFDLSKDHLLHLHHVRPPAPTATAFRSAQDCQVSSMTELFRTLRIAEEICLKLSFISPFGPKTAVRNGRVESNVLPFCCRVVRFLSMTEVGSGRFWIGLHTRFTSGEHAEKCCGRQEVGLEAENWSIVNRGHAKFSIVSFSRRRDARGPRSEKRLWTNGLGRCLFSNVDLVDL